MLISRGNMKLGSLPNFSLPVITTCPGKTPFCVRFCFGLKGRFTQDKLKRVNDRRLEATLRSDFVETIIKEIQKTNATAFRLHVIGDFYSVEYIEKWIEIAKALPHVTFVGSTRSWHCDHLYETLMRLRDLKNVYLKASTDITDNIDPATDGWWIWTVEGDGTPCLHDSKIVSNCAVCPLCYKTEEVNITFHLRWGKKDDYLAMAH